jgi:hypothetical protein
MEIVTSALAPADAVTVPPAKKRTPSVQSSLMFTEYVCDDPVMLVRWRVADFDWPDVPGMDPNETLTGSSATVAPARRHPPDLPPTTASWVTSSSSYAMMSSWAVFRSPTGSGGGPGGGGSTARQAAMGRPSMAAQDAPAHGLPPQ